MVYKHNADYFCKLHRFHFLKPVMSRHDKQEDLCWVSGGCSSWQRMPAYPTSSNLITVITTFGKAVKFYQAYGVHLHMIYLTLSVQNLLSPSQCRYENADRLFLLADHPFSQSSSTIFGAQFDHLLEHGLTKYKVNRAEFLSFCAFPFL